MAARRLCKFDMHQVTAFCDNIDATAPADLTLSFMEVKEAELDRRYFKLVGSYEDYVVGDEQQNLEEFNDDISQRYEVATNRYQKMKAKMVSMIRDAMPQQNNETANHNETVIRHAPAVKLPPCDTPTFEGGYSKWPAFRDMFQAVFGNHPYIAPAQKLYHLRNKTRGEAYQIVKRFDLVDENFDLAWEALKNRYENKRILVNQQMKQLFGIPTAQNETTKSIRAILNGINDSLSIFKSYKIEVTNWDPLLVHLCCTKLPEETLRSWEDSFKTHKELPTWQEMSEFLSKRIEILETVSDMRKPSGRDNNSSKPQVFYAKPEKKSNGCKKCRQNHPLWTCPQFRALSPIERKDFVFSSRSCINCLAPDHFLSKCPSTKVCFKCKLKHHTMVHFETNQRSRNDERSRNGLASRVQPQTHSREYERPSGSGTQGQNVSLNTQTTTTPCDNNEDLVHSHFMQNEGTTILPTALVYVEHLGEAFTIRALLDSGSEKSFVSKRMQQTLSLPMEAHSSQISGLGGTIVGDSNGKCHITLRSRGSDFTIKIKAIVVPKLTHFLPSRRIRIQNIEEIRKLDLADPYFFKPAAIDMIIGSDYLPFINLEGVKSNIACCLEARESQFGWYLSGPEPRNRIQAFSTTVSTSEDMLLHEEMKKFWELEEAERVESSSEDDKYCEQYFKDTTSRQSDGRYVVRLPFREEFPREIYLGPSRNMALAQYHRMEKTLAKTPDLRVQYNKVLQEYIDLEHMEPVVHQEANCEIQFSFFLPHHSVHRPESKSTKVRVVFNASKKTNSGSSLNDVLHQGPTLQTDLTQIMISWRNYQYVFTGDIEKMYRQILLHEADRPYQRIVFQSETDDFVKSYQLNTVTFGVNCAPFLAIRTLQQLSEDCKSQYPEAATILKNEIYVDDILSGGHTLEEAKEKQTQLNQALASAGFPMKKVTANNQFLLEHLGREDLLDEDFLKLYDSSNMKTLGVRWNAMSDTFYYVVESSKIAPSTTKRQILSVIAKLFDPLGWLGPIVVVAKLIMQELWEEKIDWDETVPPNILEKWSSFIQNIPDVSKLQIPRWVNFYPNHQVQIHGYCDSSEKAYCGAIYMRTFSSNGEIKCNLLVAKTKVAPLKKTTIPKLELCGALLLSKMVRNFTANLTYEYELFLWTDSSIVLGWLQKAPQTLKTFVANRVTKIMEITNINQWRHVKTDDNPADLGTRGCSPQELIESKLWWHGPPWLSEQEELWPIPRTFDPTDLETKKISSSLHIKSTNIAPKINPQETKTQEDSHSEVVSIPKDFLEDFSCLGRALRVLSYRIRYINRVAKRPFSTASFVTSEEITYTKNRLIAIAQLTHFPKECDRLQNKQPLSRKSRLLTLNPFIDKDGLLRVGGRLSNSELSYEERHPIIIPERCYFARLLVNYTHKILLHAEHHVMLRALRQGFYIPRSRNIIRKCIRECTACTIYKHKFQNQIMAELPPERVNFSLPFTYTGVDFAGPFSLKSSPLRNAKIIKGYVAVFVCFSTRAVHLEVCSDLSTDCFLACFDRFTGRRGLPKTMFSDNGRNFLGASLKLLKDHNIFLKTAEKSLIEKYGSHGFNWSFIPPYAPHMGGLWEAAVKSMKSHLKKVVSNNLNFTFEELSTLIIRIEAVLNSRPMSPLTENPNELLPLTPGHLLRGAPLVAPPEAPEEPPLKSLSFIKRWDRLKAIQHVFARRWKNEYITELQRRYKWKTESNNVKINDFVIVKDDLLPPSEWRLGRITKLIYGRDKRVRVAEIKTQNGIIERAIVKLCVLPSTNCPPDSLPTNNIN